MIYANEEAEKKNRKVCTFIYYIQVGRTSRSDEEVHGRPGRVLSGLYCIKSKKKIIIINITGRTRYKYAYIHSCILFLKTFYTHTQKHIYIIYMYII